MQTKNVAVNGWDEIKIDENPFFIQPETKTLSADLIWDDSNLG